MKGKEMTACKTDELETGWEHRTEKSREVLRETQDRGPRTEVSGGEWGQMEFGLRQESFYLGNKYVFIYLPVY